MDDLPLRLERPLVSFDLETTGLNPREDRIVEVSCVKLFPDGKKETRTRRLNPGRPIPPEATEVHGIRDEDVAHEPTFNHIAQGLHGFLRDADLTGFNLESFDLPLLKNEFRRVGMDFPDSGVRVIDSRKIFFLKEPRTLSAALRFYCGKELEDAHTAEADAQAAVDVLLAQIRRYDDLPDEMAALHAFCHPTRDDWLDPDGKIVWKNNEAVLGFGRHRNRSLRELAADESDYLKWILGKDFSAEVQRLVSQALEGRFPTKPST